MENQIHPAIANALEAQAAQVRENTDLIVCAFLKRWGDGIFADELTKKANNPAKPLILIVDWMTAKTEIATYCLEKAGFLATTAHQGRIMLAKVHVLQPSLIVTGLNTLHFYPPAYAWALVNAGKPDGIPMIFVTAAGGWRYRLEIPESPRVRIQGYGAGNKSLAANAQELIQM